MVLTGVVLVFAAPGPLDPPAGPVSSTYKSLAEVEPRIAITAANTPGDSDSLYKITQAGSYYLAGNLSGVSGKMGIEVAASDVTIDLNGFTVQGVAGTLDGISCTVANSTSISVLNGTVRGWGLDGIDLASAFVMAGRIERVVAEANSVDGIKGGTQFVIAGCSARGNGGNGLQGFSACTFDGCTAEYNTLGGFSGLGCEVDNCMSLYNGGAGFIFGDDSVCRGCTASFNGTEGFTFTTGSTISDCSAGRNKASGFSIGSRCIITGCTASVNAVNAASGANIKIYSSDNLVQGNNCTGGLRGIQVQLAGNIIIRNVCSGNTTNWDIVAGNALAPIVNATTNGSAVIGNTYAGNLGSSDPNANYTY